MVEQPDLETWVWGDPGTQPQQGEETYQAGQQPIAAWDNWVQWAITTDLRNIHSTIGELDDVFVNTNRPDSVEEMEGPLGTPRLDLTDAETVEIFNSNEGPASDNLHLRQRDSNDTSDNAFVYERYSEPDDNLTEIFAAMDDGSDSVRYKEDELYREDHPVGTEDNPVPEGHYTSLSSSSVDADELLAGANPERRMVTTSDEHHQVPGDYPTIQAAVDDIPRYVQHEYIIEVSNGTYDEHVLLRGVTTAGYAPSGAPHVETGSMSRLLIVGDNSTPSNVTVNSISAVGCDGIGNPQFRGFEITADSIPYWDEGTALMASSCQSLELHNINFNSGYTENGAVYYNSGGKILQCDFGNGNYNYAMSTKRGGFLTSVENTGSVADAPYSTQQGGIINFRLDSLTGDQRWAKPGGGFVIDNDTGETYTRTNAGMKAVLDGQQTIAAGAQAKVRFDSTRFDHNNEFDAANSAFVAADDSVYQINARAGMSHTLNARFTVEVDGTTRAQESLTKDNDFTGSIFTASLSTALELARGDIVEVYMANADGSVDLTLSNEDSKTSFDVVKVG